MELTIQCVAKHKAGFKAGDVWYNTDKKAALDFSSLHPGDVINADVSEFGGKSYVKSYTLATGATSAPKTGSANSSQNNSAKDLSIARSVALKAAVECKSMNDEELAAVTSLADQFTTWLTKSAE